MHSLIKTSCASLFLVVVIASGSFKSFADHNSQIAYQPSDHSTFDTIEPRDLSGKYSGRATVSDPGRNNYLLTGVATLQIDGERFSLTDKRGRQVNGAIKAKWIVEKSLGVGSVKLDNEADETEIRWYRVGNIFKIVRAAGANRVLRFCSNGIRRPQCLAEAEF